MGLFDVFPLTLCELYDWEYICDDMIGYVCPACGRKLNEWELIFKVDDIWLCADCTLKETHYEYESINDVEDIE